jgi:hypothetical protein
MPLKSLQEIYELIENDALTIDGYNKDKIIAYFLEFRDQVAENDKYGFARKAQIEIDVQNFDIQSNKLGPFLTGTDKEGHYYEYPSLKKFTTKDFEYLIERQYNTNSVYLKIRYSHLLWLSPKKHLQFASEALTGYKFIVKHLNKVVWDKESHFNVYELQLHIYNAFYLALSTGKQEEINDIKKIILGIVRKFRFKSKKTYSNIGLINLMMANPKFFGAEEYKKLDEHCWKLAHMQDSLFYKIDILKIGQKIAMKLGKKSTEWFEAIAQSYEDLSIVREDGMNLVAMEFCLSSLKYYKKLRYKTKIKATEDRYKQLKQSMKLGSYVIDMEVADIMKEINKVSSNVSERSSNYILNFLMYSGFIFPKYANIREEVLRDTENNILSLLNSQVIDRVGHTAAHYSNQSEREHFSITMALHKIYMPFSIIRIKEIIFKASMKNKLSSDTVINFLKTTWLGGDLVLSYKDSNEKTYNWLGLLAPGLNDFFSQLAFCNMNSINQLSVVLAIDSLSLKIEGILRDMYELRGFNTFYSTTDNANRSIVREKDINTLLYGEDINKILNEDDLMLLRYLLIDKSGLNLRNDIAHTLIRTVEDYNLSFILLLIVAILRLAKEEYAPPILP